MTMIEARIISAVHCVGHWSSWQNIILAIHIIINITSHQQQIAIIIITIITLTRQATWQAV